MKRIMMEKLKIYKMKFFIDMNFTRLKKCHSKIKIHLLKITNKKHPTLKWMHSKDAILNSMLAYRKNQS
jgi:hypothetical protein